MAVEDLFKPFWENLEKQLTRQLLRRYIQDPNVIFRFDLSNVSALQEEESIRIQKFSNAWNNSTISMNTYLKGLGLDELEGGDELFKKGELMLLPTPEELREQQELGMELMRQGAAGRDESEDEEGDRTQQQEEDEEAA